VAIRIGIVIFLTSCFLFLIGIDFSLFFLISRFFLSNVVLWSLFFSLDLFYNLLDWRGFLYNLGSGCAWGLFYNDSSLQVRSVSCCLPRALEQVLEVHN